LEKTSPKAGEGNQQIFQAVRDLGPGELIDFLEQCALLLPEDFRYRLRKVVASAGTSSDGLQRALEVVRAQWAGLRARDTVRLAVVGPARVGKSSLIAAIGEGNVERIASIFSLVDLQGLEEYLGYGRSERAYEEMEPADLTLAVLDGSAGFTPDTVRIVRRFAAMERPLLVALNKMDLVESPRKVVNEAKSILGVSVIPVAAHRPESVKRLLRAIVAACPKALYPLAENLPSFRRGICKGIVSQASFGSGLIGALRIPVADVLPISAIQVAMLLKLARAHGFSIGRGRARELAALLASGLLVREGGHRLKQMYPERSMLISISVGGLWTYLVGLAAVRYFERLAFLTELDEGMPMLRPEESAR